MPIPNAKTIEQLLAEVNAITDPRDVTTWWRENYDLIEAAQRRAAYKPPPSSGFILPGRKR